MSVSINIYAQDGPHDDTIILVNHDGLLALKEAVDKALETGLTSKANMVAGDGEGFTLFIHQSEDVSRYATPYVEKMFRDCDKRARTNLADLYKTLYSLES